MLLQKSFSVVAFKTLTFHKDTLRCDGIFIDSTINKFSPVSDSETSLKIGQYLTKLIKTYKTKCASFLSHLVEPTPIGTTNSGSIRIDRFPNLFIYECHDIDVK